MSGMKSHCVPEYLSVDSSEGSPACELEEGGRSTEEDPVEVVRRVRDGIASGKYDQLGDQLLADIHGACERASEVLERQELDPRQSSLLTGELQACAPLCAWSAACSEHCADLEQASGTGW